MPTFTFKSFGAELDKLNAELQGAASRKIARDMAERAKRIAIAQASKDLGGNAEFDGERGRGSGWPGRSLSDLTIKDARRGVGVWMFPTKKSGGPWKVAEQGRNQGDAKARGGGALFFGPSIDRRTGDTFRTKTGKIRNTRSKAKRWSGYTQGKNTATDARAVFERELPKIAERGVRAVTVKHFDVT